MNSNKEHKVYVLSHDYIVLMRCMGIWTALGVFLTYLSTGIVVPLFITDFPFVFSEYLAGAPFAVIAWIGTLPLCFWVILAVRKEKLIFYDDQIVRASWLFRKVNLPWNKIRHVEVLNDRSGKILGVVLDTGQRSRLSLKSYDNMDSMIEEVRRHTGILPTNRISINWMGYKAVVAGLALVLIVVNVSVIVFFASI